MRAALVPILMLLVSGCIFQKGSDDLSIVCEVRSGSPGPAYLADGLLAATHVDDANLSAADAKTLIAAAAKHVITIGHHAHATLNATLRASPEGERFHADGYASNGSLVDSYDLVLAFEGGVAVAHETRPALLDIAAPPSMQAEAMAVVNMTSELSGIPTRTPTMVATGWDPATPSCVRLLYQDGPSDAITPATNEHPHTLVVVSLVADRVVSFDRDHWSADATTTPYGNSP